ncbi:DoxX family protein [Galbibacter sp. EGI 63066]|uniref:DoxX family protein n=1 Tax=Galbibacter sp. EGI 63066 TaxID=2993559 RepID=UPI002249235E|nr:DoxX family protein [Galbibacter sp. EGI 63066]MCX2678957.1 DoxX family protein [Galbibacter sp. EGI 63066]
MTIKKILYWIATGLLCLFLAYALFNYISQFSMIKEMMAESSGYPSYLIYILITGKTLAIIALLSNIKGVIKEWAYAGLFFNFLLALFVHYSPDGDGKGGGAIIAMVLLIASYFLGRQARPWLKSH